jgi:hypothetical protein
VFQGKGQFPQLLDQRRGFGAFPTRVLRRLRKGAIDASSRA